MTSKTLDLGKFQDLAAPKPEITVGEVDVLLHPEHVELLAYELSSSYNNMVEHRGGKAFIDGDLLYKFFITCIVERVKYVRNEPNRYKNMVQYNAHPHLIGVIVANIGKCFDDQTNIELSPKIDSLKFQQDILSELQFLDVSRSFLSLRSLGISVGLEFPSDKKGDFLTMSFSYIESNQSICREDSRAHPTQALIALIAGLNLVSGITTPRVTYITKDRIDTLIRATAQFEFSK